MESSSTGTSSVSLQSMPINKWTNDQILEWLSRRLPAVYEKHKDSFVQNEITGESILANSFSHTCLDQLKIFDKNLREQLLSEIALLKIRNEYEFIKRFKSMKTCVNNM